jgi:P-type E1-E2 ATPase
LTDTFIAPGFARDEVMTLVASLERYSRHPLARAVLAAQPDLHALPEASEVSEPPGTGLRGVVAGYRVAITSRPRALEEQVTGAEQLPSFGDGLECAVIIDDRAAALLQFRDAPRDDSRSFVAHLGPAHHFNRVMIVSGDRASEVRYLAEHVGVTEIHAQQSPEEKLAIVRAETGRARTLYVGDGINDAPAMMAATVGVANGQNSDVTTEAASVVILDNSLRRVDEFMHISRRMRTIALQSAVGGMALSVAGMLFASAGWLTPVEGAIGQELIDVAAVVNALRAALRPKQMYDM